MKKQLLFYLIIFCALVISKESYSQNWQRVGSGLPSHFANSNNEIIEFNGNMYSVGYVYDGISTYTPKVFMLSGGTWSEVGSGFTTTTTAGVYNIKAITEFNAELYIGGNFIMNNGVDAEFYDVAKWDNLNSRWVPVGDGTGDGVVNELTVFNSKLYAGGDFGDLGAAGTNNIAVFDGTSWGTVGTGMSIEAVALEDPDQISSMVVYNNELIVGGKFSTAGGELAHNIAKWDGVNWAYLKGTVIEGGGGVGGFNNGQVYVMALQVFGTDLYIGGTFTTYYNISYIGSSTVVPNHLVVWDGAFFSAPTKATPANIRINAMTVFNNRIYIGSEVDANIYSWDGGIFDWSLEPNRDPIRQRVSSFYSNATDIYYAQTYGVYQLKDPLPSFYASSTSVCAGQEVTFTDTSNGTNTITAWNWTFAGGTPATSTDQNPVVTFAAGGPYDVTLEVTSSDGINSYTIVDYITIEDVVNISGEPSSLSVCSSENATFSVSGVSATNGATYQWLIDEGTGFVDMVNVSGEISGATSSTLILYPPISIDGASVKCVVTNGCGSTTTSAEALLTVTAAPEITSHPAAQAVCVSGDASYTVEASVVSGTLTYQWQYWVNPTTYIPLSDGAIYGGTNTATLTITGADNTLAELADADNSDGKTAAYYRCVLTANGCSVNSGLAYLNIHDAPTVTADPIDVTKCDIGNGINTYFSVTSSIVVGGLTYQWQVDDGTGYVDVVDDAVYSGATTKDLMLTSATSALSGNAYKCIIGNCSTPVESLGATLTIDDQPVLTAGPVLTNICEGSDVEFTVTTTGTNLSYQWEVAPSGSSTFTAITNDLTYFAAGGVLQISGATLGLHNYRYRCVITSGSCSLNTGAGTLRVYAQPTLTNSTAASALTICEGGSTTLRVNPSSSVVSGVHTYQWQSDNGIGVFTDITDGTNYINTNTRLLTINSTLDNTLLSFSGNQYRCVIRGCVTENASTPETLTVNQLPLVTTSPISQTVCVGESTTFTAEATAGTGVTYLWYYSSDGGVNYSSYAALSGMSGYNTSTLTISYAYLGYNGYLFKCVASSASPCTVTSESNPATLTVNETAITTQPVSSVTICNGESTSYTVVASGSGLTYQWYASNVAITDGGEYSGATTATLSITGATTALNGALYYCVVNGSCTAVTSNYSYLYVYGVDKPIIGADFSNPSSPYLYVSNVYGDMYEWFFNGSLYSSAYDIYVDQAGSYTVIVSSNGCSSVESDAQVIIVTDMEKDVLSKVQAYPNPVTDNLIIRLALKDENTIIRVLSIDGKVEINQYANELENTVNMTHLNEGAYLVQIINAEKTLTYKVIKQ